MFREMIPLLLLFLKIVLSSAQAVDNAQPTQLPDGKICLFTCSEWIFKEKVQQFAPSADLLGPGYLSKHKIGFSNDDPNSKNSNDSPMQYQKVWGAVYSINKNEYDAVLKQSQTEYSVPFASNEDVFVVKYQEMNCLVVDLGIQPGDHPPWRHFNMKIPNTIEDEMYFNRLAQIGVPPEYIKGLRNASTKPQYHPIIPQDYHPRDIGHQPKRTFDQLPNNRIYPTPHDRGIPPMNGQIPETHDTEIPGLSLPATPMNSVQPNKSKLLPGVPNPNSQPQVITDQPEYVRGTTPLTYVQPSPQDVQVTVPKGLDSGVTTTPDHQPVVVITPMKLPGSSAVKPVIAQPIDTVQNQSPIVVPGKGDNSNVILPSNGPVLTTHQPKEIDDTVPTKITGIAHPPTSNTIYPTVTGVPQTPVDDQSYVVITPLKLPQNNGNLASAPVVGQDYKVQTPLSVQPDDTQQILVPRTIDDDSTNPKNIPPMLLGAPTQQTKVGPVVTQQPSGSLLTPDVIAPPKLQVQSPDLLINPLPQPGIDHTPESLPTSYNIPCDHDVPGANSGLLTLSPHPDLTIAHQNDSPLLTLNDVPHADQSTTPMFYPDQTGSVITPGVVNTKPVQQVNGPAVISGQSPVKPALVSHQVSPNTLNVNNNPDNLLVNTAPNHLQLHPDVDHTVHSIPTTFNIPKATPVFPQKPMFGFDQCHQPTNDISHIPTSTDNQPTTTSYQINPNTLEHVDNPDLLLTNTAPNHLQLQPTGDQNIHNVDNPNLLLPNTAPNHLQLHPTGDHTLNQIPASFGVEKPPPYVSDKPMFTVDQPNCLEHPTTTSYQVNPNTLDHVDNPNLLLPNTAPNHLQLQPTGDQNIHNVDNPNLLLPNTAPNHLQVHPLPATFNVDKPAAVLPSKPMFGFDQSNPPPCAIPATFGISNQQPTVQDTPMFSVNGSPSVLQPKHIDDNSIPASTVTPINTVDQPHATGLLPNLVHNQDTQPGYLVSQPPTVPLTTNSIPASTTVHQLPNQVDSHPTVINSKPTNVIGTTNIPESSMLQTPNPVVTSNPDTHTVQIPHQVVDNSHPIQSTTKPTSSLIGTTNIPQSSLIQEPNPVVNVANPTGLTSQPDKIPLAATIPDHTVQVPNQVVSSDQPDQLVAKPNLIGTTNIPQSTLLQAPNPVINDSNPTLVASKPDNVPLTTSPAVVQPVNNVGQVQTPKISQPVQQVPPPPYTSSSFMAPNYTPVSPALGYSFAHRYPQYLHNSNYKPPNCFYNPDELIPGFTFGSHIQLY